MKFLSSLSLIILLLFSSCCFSTKLEVIQISNFSPASADEQSQLIKELIMQEQEIHSVRAMFDLRIKQHLIKNTFLQSVVFERPDSFRLELFTAGLNRLMSLVIGRDGRIQALDMREGIVFSGSSAVSNIERLVSVPFAAEEMMLWLTGRFLVPSAEDEQSRVKVLKGGEEEEFVAQYWADDKRYIRLLYSRILPTGQLRLKMVEIYGLEKELLFSSSIFWPTAEAGINLAYRFPSKITFWLVKADISAELMQRQFEINPNLSEINERIFAFGSHENMRRVDLDLSVGGE